MGLLRRVLAIFLLSVALSPVAGAQPSPAGQVDARHKPGPVTLRGVASHVRAHDFTLVTHTKGSFQVTTTSATQISEKGKSGHISLREGDHVGVRGFVTGRQIRAIDVRIYPTKPKDYDIRGTIRGVQGSRLLVDVAGKIVQVRLTSQTEIRIGNQPSSAGQLKTGDRVQVRVQPGDQGLTALTIHVYRSQARARHVELRGTVTAVGAGSLTLRSGSSSYAVQVNGQTAVYVGNQRSSAQALKSGEAVTVYACCTGQPLVATSIHIRKTRTTRSSVELRGRVIALSSDQLRIATAQGTLTIRLESSTTFEIGSSPVTRASVEIGDEVSVRAYRAGSTLVATRVHVYASSRRPHTVQGVVVAVSRSGLVIVARGKRVAVIVSRGTALTLNGSTTSLSRLRVGDRVRVVGRLTADGGLSATEISARRAAPKIKTVTVRGTILQVSGAALVIEDGFGGRHQVRLAAGARILLAGKQAPSAALFPGVTASARGHLVGGILIASTLTLFVKSRTVEGRVSRAGQTTIALQLASGQGIPVDVPRGVLVADGSRRLHPASLHNGVYLRVQGYVEPSQAVRAVSLRVLHPTLDFSATVLANDGTIVVETSKGERFQLRFSAATEISTGREQVTLTPTEIPVGVRVHVSGAVRSDGTLAVTRLTVRLVSATVSGSVSAIGTDVLTVQTGASAVDAKLSDQTTYMQGSHALALTDLVVGDEVTVDGYGGGPGIEFARKVLVHRRLEGLDGTVASLTADGFVLNAGDGSHRVIVSGATNFTGGTSADLAVGVAVHVTGYRRGDGVILATRVRLVRRKSSYVQLTNR